MESQPCLWSIHSSRQCRISHPLSRSRDLSCILMDTSQICCCCATVGTPYMLLLILMPDFFFFGGGGLFAFSGATLVALGGSQDRGPIGAVPPTYATATSVLYPSRICDLNHGSQQCRILNALNEARDQTCVLMNASQIGFHWATTGIPAIFLYSF